MQSFYLKLRAITRALKSWSQRRVGNIKEQLLVSQELIRQFDLAQDYRHAAPSAEKENPSCFPPKNNRKAAWRKHILFPCAC
jgi:hypothetical protein